MQQFEQWVSTSGRLLGAIFYLSPQHPSSQSVLSFFQQPDWQQQWLELKHAGSLIPLIEQGLSEDLEEQYQRLFIGPNQLIAPPWGSVYLDPESVIFGNSLLALRDFLQQQQIIFEANSNEPEDHFGLMLMLAAYIAENKPSLLTEFLTQHLLPWSGRYLELLSQQTESPFYQAMALLAQQTLAYWQSYLGLSIPKAQLYR